MRAASTTEAVPTTKAKLHEVFSAGRRALSFLERYRSLKRHKDITMTCEFLLDSGAALPSLHFFAFNRTNFSGPLLI